MKRHYFFLLVAMFAAMSSWAQVLNEGFKGASPFDGGTAFVDAYTQSDALAGTGLLKNNNLVENKNFKAGAGNFRADCSAVTVGSQWLEDFNTYLSGEFPNCWTRTVPYNLFPQITVAQGIALHFNGSAVEMVSTPEFVEDVKTLEIEFDLKRESTFYSGTFEVGVLSDPNDANTFVLIQNVTSLITVADNNYDRYTVSLSSAPAGYHYIAFRQNPISSWYYWLDNIDVHPAPACPKPTEFKAVNILNDGAKLLWTEIGTADAWIVEYKKASENESEYVPVSVSTLPVHLLSSLDPNTVYDVRVKAVCEEGVESKWLTADFKTACNLAALPFNEDFSTWTTGLGKWNPCWVKYTGTGAYSPDIPYVDTPYGKSLIFSQTNTTISAAFLPLLDVDGKDLLLKFDLQMPADNRMDIVTATDLQDANTWTKITTLSNGIGVGTSNYIDNEIVIPNYQAGTYIGFKSHTGNSVSAYLDDINIDIAPSCLRPTITSIKVTNNSATVKINENGSASDWQYVVSDNSVIDLETATVIDVNTDVFTIPALDANTQYYIWVRSYCAATDQSKWTKSNFKTDCDAFALPFTDDFSTWDANISYFNSCWKKYTGADYNGYSYPYVVTANGQSLSFSQSNGTISAAFLPILDADGKDLMLEFDLQMSNANKMDVVIAADPQDKNTWTVITTLTGKGVGSMSNYIHNETIIENYQEGTYIGFKSHTGSYPSVYLDNINIDVAPTCLRPLIESTSVTANSAEVKLTEQGDATDWQYVVSTNSTIDLETADIFDVDANPFTIPDLDANTQYYVWVRSYCAATDQSKWTKGDFKTACGVFNLPFFENFSDWTASNTYFDPCWTKYTGTDYFGSNYPYVSTIYGEKVLNFMQSIPSINAAFLPLLDADGKDLMLEFDLQMSSNNRMSIITATDPHNQSTWNVITTLDNGAGLGIGFTLHNEVIIENYQEGTYIGFKSHTGGYTSAYLDNVKVDIAPTCLKPVVTLDNATAETAIINWTHATATDFKIEWGLQGFVPGTNNGIDSVDVSALFYTIPDLNANTVYDVYVKAICGNDDVSAWGKVTFITQCGVIVVTPENPYIEDAENENNINCWEVVNDIGYMTVSYRNSSSTGYYIHVDFSSAGNKISLISPVYDITALTVPALSIKHTEIDYADIADELRVYYRASELDEWTLIPEMEFTTPYPEGTWNIDTVILPNPSATYQLRFEITSNYVSGVDLDDVMIFEGVTKVITKEATDITSSSAVLHKTVESVIPVLTEGFDYRVIDAENWQTSLTGILFDLTADTEYEFKAFAKTIENDTYYGEILTFKTFETEIVAPTVITIDATDVTINSAVLHKTVIAGDKQIETEGFKYSVEGEENWETVDSDGILSDLEEGTVYEFKAFATTEDDIYYGEILTFKTQTTDIDVIFDGNIALYPNPAKQIATLQIDGLNAAAQVVITDLTGKTVDVYNLNASETQLKINVSNIADGTYFVKVISDKAIPVQKLVVKK